MKKNEIRLLLHPTKLKKENTYRGNEGICKPDTKSINHKGKRLMNVTTFKFKSLLKKLS